MLLSSKDRPKADGLPVPSAELATGTCKQIGNFALLQVSQAERADRMSLQGRGRESAAPGPDGLHSAMPGTDWREIPRSGAAVSDINPVQAPLATLAR